MLNKAICIICNNFFLAAYFNLIGQVFSLKCIYSTHLDNEFKNGASFT